MDALRLGDPWDLSTDVGPLIDAEAHEEISAYCQRMEGEGRLLHRPNGPEANGYFLAPHVVRVRGIEQMEREIFGPVLHVARFDAERLDEVIDAVNARGYGLTFGLHTRIDARVQHVLDRVHAGNAYVNRNQIGAIVGAQPFGGEGLSGTGPKAGGPLYLSAFQRTRRLKTPTPSLPLPRGGGGASVTTSALSDVFGQINATQWAARQDRNVALRALLRGRAADAMSAAAGLDHGPIDLPGPTGESNRYQLVPRGRVLCLGPTDSVVDQAVQALAGGNVVVAVVTTKMAVLADLAAAGLPVAQIEGAFDGNVGSAPVDAVAWARDDERATVLRRALAAREGAIIPVIRETIAPAAYCHERAVCIDTTAAGGNTALLAANS